jgi:hypothetical protein
MSQSLNQRSHLPATESADREWRDDQPDASIQQPGSAPESHAHAAAGDMVSTPPSETAISADKAKGRNRLTKADRDEKKERIIAAYNKGESLTLLRRELELSKTQLNTFMAELFISGAITPLEKYRDCVFEFSNIVAVVKSYLPDITAKSLLTMEEESGVFKIRLTN